jgi:hypothetical protein
MLMYLWILRRDLPAALAAHPAQHARYGLP